MVVGEIPEAVDLLVVGGGPGGYVAAVRAAELGREVVLVERGGREGGLGGACLHVGCIPSKALIELAGARSATTALAAAGLVAEDVRVDLGRFQAWKRGIVDDLAGGVEGLLDRHGVQRIAGELRFTGADRAAVALSNGNGSHLQFTDVIVATGSRPTPLGAVPFDGRRVLTSTDALDLDTVPESIAIVGAGYIGLELGMALAKLGARVTVVEALDRVLPAVDASLTRPLERSLERHGVALRLGALAQRLEDGALVVDGPQGEQRIPVEKVVVAVGRTPNTDDLGLEHLGVEPGADGLIAVDERRMAAPHVAAIGDVTAGPALAHKASAEGVVAAEALCGRAVAFEPRTVPAVIFTDPEIATAGLTEAEARAAGHDVATSTVPLAANGRARTLGAREGFTKLVADRATDQIVGVHVVGPHASELIAEGVLAIEMIAAPADLGGTIHPHPTLSEGLHAAVERLTAAAPAVAHR